jgi:hypothetical protein
VKALIQGVNAARRKCTEAQVDSSVLLLVRQARQLLELVSSADGEARSGVRLVQVPPPATVPARIHNCSQCASPVPPADNLMQLVVHSGVEAVLPLLTLADRTRCVQWQAQRSTHTTPAAAAT